MGKKIGAALTLERLRADNEALRTENATLRAKITRFVKAASSYDIDKSRSVAEWEEVDREWVEALEALKEVE